MNAPKLFMFDLDGTLAESKQPLKSEMTELLARLLIERRVGIISGGALPQFLTQIIDQFPTGANFANLYLLPTSGAALYEHNDGDWKKIYEERLTDTEAEIIDTAMRDAATETGLIDFSKPAYGERIEHRGAQVTLSALGQKAPIDEKKAWDPTHAKRYALRVSIAGRLPESQFSTRIGGATSIDVTKHGIDKAYGIRKLCERINILEADALYVGDELRSGGNDEAVYKTNVQVRAVENPEDTMKIITSFLS